MKKAFQTGSLPLDSPCVPPICRPPIACTFVDKNELVREVRQGHMLTKLFALELVSLNRYLRQLVKNDQMGGGRIYIRYSPSSLYTQISEVHAIHGRIGHILTRNTL